VRFSQIVENTKTRNRVTKELTGNFRSSWLSVDQTEAVLWRMEENGWRWLGQDGEMLVKREMTQGGLVSALRGA
jgi:hypothetical protein